MYVCLCVYSKSMVELVRDSMKIFVCILSNFSACCVRFRVRWQMCSCSFRFGLRTCQWNSGQQTSEHTPTHDQAPLRAQHADSQSIQPVYVCVHVHSNFRTSVCVFVFLRGYAIKMRINVLLLVVPPLEQSSQGVWCESALRFAWARECVSVLCFRGCLSVYIIPFIVVVVVSMRPRSALYRKLWKPNSFACGICISMLFDCDIVRMMVLCRWWSVADDSGVGGGGGGVDVGGCGRSCCCYCWV